MRLVASMGLGLMLALAATAGVAAQTWSEYRPAGGRYRVEVPGIPKEDTAQVSVQGKNIPMKQATVELADAAYLVTYLDYPAEAVAGLTPQQALANTRDGSAKGHRLVSDRTLTVSGFVVEQKGNVILVIRSTFTGVRLYQAIVVTEGGGVNRPLTRRFIDSFNLVTP